MPTAFGSFTSQVLTSADLNTAGGAWTTFTPSFTNFTLGNGTIDRAAYEQIGRSVDVFVRVTLGSTSSVTGAITLTLPVTGLSTSAYGRGTIYDSSATTYYHATVQGLTTTTVRLMALNAAATYTTEAATSGTVPMTWATGDIFLMTFRYEAAADGT